MPGDHNLLPNPDAKSLRGWPRSPFTALCRPTPHFLSTCENKALKRQKNRNLEAWDRLCGENVEKAHP